MKPSPTPRPFAAALVLAAAFVLLAQCRSSDRDDGRLSSTEGWAVVYDVLQHPRCLNCHPDGDVPLQGEESVPHAQNVQRGPDGHGRFALTCSACHQSENTPGPHMPPGAPAWHLPHPDAPLVFEGLTSRDLCRQMKDPARNGGRTPAQVLEHMTHDPLVLWGWDPGEGREPVPVPHETLVAALRAWVDGGCQCP